MRSLVLTYLFLCFETASFPSFSPLLLFSIMHAAVLLLLSTFSAALGRPTHDRGLVVRSQLETPPVGYVAADAPTGESIKLTVAMPQNNVAGLHSAVLGVSDPSLANYRRHLSKSEVIFVARRNHWWS